MVEQAGGDTGASGGCDAASSVRACRRASATWPFALLLSCNCFRRPYRPRPLSPVLFWNSNHVLTSASSIPGETPFHLYCIHTTRSSTRHLDHGSQEERRCCSRSLDCPSFDSQTCPWTDICFISAHQASSRIRKAQLGQDHCPQLVGRSRDRFGRVGSLCSGHSPACQAD
jgi:hypothetical protein